MLALTVVLTGCDRGSLASLLEPGLTLRYTHADAMHEGRVVFEHPQGVPTDMTVAIGRNPARPIVGNSMDFPVVLPDTTFTVSYELDGAPRGPEEHPYVQADFWRATMRESFEAGDDFWGHWDGCWRPEGFSFHAVYGMCALQTIEYGFGPDLDRVLPIPACTEVSIPEFPQPPDGYVTAPPSATRIGIRLTYYDGTASETRWLERPACPP